MKLPDLKVERIRLAFNVFEDKNIIVLHHYDFGVDAITDTTKDDLETQLKAEGVQYASIQRTPTSIILRRI